MLFALGLIVGIVIGMVLSAIICRAVHGDRDD